MDCIEAQPTRSGSRFVFPADCGDGHFIGVVSVLDRICRKGEARGREAHRRAGPRDRGLEGEIEHVEAPEGCIHPSQGQLSSVSPPAIT